MGRLARVLAGRGIAFDFNSRMALLDAALLYGLAIRAKDEDGGLALDLGTFPATLLLMAGLATVMPRLAVTGDADVTVLQSDQVAFRGQLVGAVIAETPEVARHAASLVRVDYEQYH